MVLLAAPRRAVRHGRVWSPTGEWVAYLSGEHDLPQLSPDSQWGAFGSTPTGVRQMRVARADGSEAYQLTKVEPGWGAFHPYWRPK